MKSKLPQPLYRSQKQRGSSIIMVLVLSFAIIIILASVLSRGITSKKINISNALYYEAKNAAESYAEYGCADIVRRFESKTSFPKDELKTDPISVPTSAPTFFTGSHLDLDSTEVKGGQIDDGYWIYLDADDPRWEFDPMKGKRVFVRDVNVFARAKAVSESIGNETTAYVQQTLQVRDSPLFSNAIFYNVDLELHPGPVMNIYGPVHTNRDAWLESLDKIYFHDLVSASSRIMHGNPKVPSNIHNQRGQVNFKNADDEWVNMRLGGSGAYDEDWLDNNHDKWRLLASQTWDGNVQDSAHNVPVYNAAGIADHVPDDPTTSANELENYAYAVIEPLLPHDHVDRKTDAVRNQKIQAKAGLIFKVEFDSTTATGLIVKAYKWARVNSSIPVNPQNPFDGNLALNANGDPYLVEVQLPSQDLFPSLGGDLIGTENSNLTGVDNATTDAEPALYKYSSGKVVTGLYDHRQDMAISPVSLDVGILRKVVDDHANPTGTNLGETYWKDSSTGVITYNPKTDWNGVVYIEFPLEDDSGGRTDQIVRMKPTVTVASGSPYYDDVGAYNGDYLEYPTGSKTYYARWDYPDIYASYKAYFRWDLVTPTTNVNLAMQVLHGEFVPSPSYCNDPGITIATNAPLYLLGNFNADGVVHTNDAQKIEHNHYQDSNGNYYDEPPASFMCDSFTLLSNRWLYNNRGYSAESSTSNRYASVFTEVSAAILTGLMPTIPEGTVAEPASGAQSGGAHNFPRFLENWSTTLTLRTSMVALYESEVHTAPMPDNHSHYYGPPTRDWGFNENFEDGVYPPGTPNVRTFRRTTFSDITEQEYLDGINF